MLKLLAQQHSITILQTGICSIKDSYWLRILRSYVRDVTVCSLTGADVWGEGITTICMANPDTHHHTPADCTLRYSNRTTGTVKCLLYSYYGTYEIVTLLRGFTCLCTQYWDTFIINTCPCKFSSPLWITLLHFQMHPLSMHNLYFSLSASCWSTETSWDL